MSSPKHEVIRYRLELAHEALDDAHFDFRIMTPEEVVVYEA